MQKGVILGGDKRESDMNVLVNGGAEFSAYVIMEGRITGVLCRKEIAVGLGIFYLHNFKSMINLLYYQVLITSNI
ncbi:hypothetical protein ACFDTO_22455 [Microbacteriaceae bacterium 4G12]